MFEGGETIKLSPSSDDFKVPKSADVVMVVEQTSCNSNPANQLGDLVDKIEQAFLKNGNRCYILTYKILVPFASVVMKSL